MTFPRPDFSSLFWRLLAGILSVIVVTSLVTGTIFYWVQKDEYAQGRIDGRIGGRKSVLAALVINEYAGREALVRWLKSEQNTRPTVYIVNAAGEEISGRKVPAAVISSLERDHVRIERLLTEQASLTGFPLNSIERVEIDGQPYYAFAMLATVPQDLTFLPFNDRETAVVAMLIALVLSALVSAVLAYYYTRPLLRLNSAMRDIASGRFDTRVDPAFSTAGAEVAGLARVFNRMAERIGALVRRQQKLFHNVSHEVRSPLARIDVAVDLARRDPEHAARYLERIEREVGNVDHLVEELLRVARLDEAAESLSKTPESIRRLVTDVVETARFEAQKKRITVALDDALERDAVLEVNAESLHSALDNLLRNSLRHTPEGGRITVRVERGPGLLRIRCGDEGPGVPENELPALFDPFVRGNREQTGTGFGLGLTIARSAVLAHGGSIRARNLIPRGLEVIVDLPLATPPAAARARRAEAFPHGPAKAGRGAGRAPRR